MFTQGVPQKQPRSVMGLLHNNSPRIHAGNPHRPHLPCGAVPQQGRDGRGWSITVCEGQRELTSRAAWVPAHSCTASEQSCGFLCRQSICTLSAHGPHLLQHSPSLGQGFLYEKKEKYTFKGNRASLGPTHRASAVATWNQTPPLIR